MPALFEPALDLGALACVLILIGMLIAVKYTFNQLASVLDFSVLGIHPLRNVANAIENTVVAGCTKGINALQHIARDLWHGLTWSITEFIDGVKTLASHTEQALGILWGTSIPNYVKGALRPIATEIDSVGAQVDQVARTLATDVTRIDAKIDDNVRAVTQTLERELSETVGRAVNGINDEIRTIKSSVDQAIQHALDLARAESQSALGELRNAENAAVGAIGSAQALTERELQDLISSVGQSNIPGIAASVGLLAQLVQTVVSETGLDNATCRNKVKDVCATDSNDWSWLISGITPIGLDLSLAAVVAAGGEILHAVATGVEDFG